MKRIVTLALLCAFGFSAQAQVTQLKDGAQPTPGTVVYSLPRTVVKLKIEVVKESYVEGPYSQYAQKYLSIDTPRKSPKSYTIQAISLMTYQEADPSQTYMLNVGSLKNARTNFLAFSEQGLVLPSGYEAPRYGQARFSVTPQAAQNFYTMGVEPNFASEATTYFNTVKTDTGFVRVPVQRSQTVEKNTERKAEEAANFIFNLRKKRADLITGDSDNIPTGEGLRAAIEESRRLEEEYLSLFIGKSYSGTETYYVDVVPDAAQSKPSYIAFRFSETQGVLPSTNVAGRPIMLELQPEKGGATGDIAKDDGKTPYIYYRVPQMVQARLIDGQQTLIQDRFAVSQLGRMLSVPAEAAMR